jgi:hypothetical protein
MVWKCPNCDEINDFVFSDVCSNCRRPRPAGVKAYEADSGGSPPAASPGSGDFSALDSIGAVVAGLGWAVAVVSGLAAVLGLAGAPGDLSLALFVPAALFTAVNGLALVAYGQLARCIVSINHNTKRAATLLERTVAPGSTSSTSTIQSNESPS